MPTSGPGDKAGVDGALTDNLPREKTETDAAAWERLKKFRSKVEKKHTCVYWKNADELKSKVIIGLTTAAKRYPAIGWVRADNIANEATLVEMLNLKNRVAELERDAMALSDRPPPGVEDLSQGEDEFEFRLGFIARSAKDEASYTAKIKQTWNGIFAAVAPCMIHEAADRVLKHAFQQFIMSEAKRTFGKQKTFKDATLQNFSFDQQDIETSIIQLNALGLIKQNDKRRSVHDKGSYWTLTPYGNTMMVKLRAIRKVPLDSEVFGEAETSK
jgi:hypothetical protein